MNKYDPLNIKSVYEPSSTPVYDAAEKYLADKSEKDYSILEAGNLAAKEPPSSRIPQPPKFKYAEAAILDDFRFYLEQTYAEHYKGENGIECFDAWIALGDATPTFRNTAMKYLWRYNRKKDFTTTKKDLYKALHYILLMIYNDHYKTTPYSHKVEKIV